VDEQQRFLVRRLKEDNGKLEEAAKIRQHKETLQYEDLRSYMLIKHDEQLNSIARIKKAHKEIETLEEHKLRLEVEVEDLANEVETREDEKCRMLRLKHEMEVDLESKEAQL